MLKFANSLLNLFKRVASVVNTDSKDKHAKKDKKSKQQEKTPGEIKPSQVRTFPNGLIIEEIQMGKPAGKRADPGKKVSCDKQILYAHCKCHLSS